MGRLASFFARLTREQASPADLDELKALLIESDLGFDYTAEILALVRRTSPDKLMLETAAHLSQSLLTGPRSIATNPDRLTTILMIGVNGTGKTTTTAKLAQRLRNEGRIVFLAAADTFRAAAVDQLKTWGERIGAPVVTGKEGSDPAAVAFEAATSAKRDGAQYLIIDTAGRLHTKSNLMAELSKIVRVVTKVTPVDEALFVLDGTTGQNGISQASAFQSAIPLTGIVVTKLDGSTKGGIALAVERALQVPVKLIGVGEGATDLKEFEPKAYIAELLTQP